MRCVRSHNGGRAEELQPKTGRFGNQPEEAEARHGTLGVSLGRDFQKNTGIRSRRGNPIACLSLPWTSSALILSRRRAAMRFRRYYVLIPVITSAATLRAPRERF